MDNNKIEVGEYARDKEGNITKIINTVSLFKDVELYLGEDGYQYSDNSILNHSKNIIDLIEVGDYVNGLEVYKGKVASGEEKLLGGNYIIKGMALEVVKIKSIVTKEQFNSIKYEIKED